MKSLLFLLTLSGLLNLVVDFFLPEFSNTKPNKIERKITTEAGSNRSRVSLIVIKRSIAWKLFNLIFKCLILHPQIFNYCRVNRKFFGLFTLYKIILNTESARTRKFSCCLHHEVVVWGLRTDSKLKGLRSPQFNGHNSQTN